MKIKNSLIIILSLLFFVACSKEIKQVDLVNDKELLVALVNGVMPQSCEYKGRVLISYKDITNSSNNTSFKAIVDKKCDGNAMIKVLGLFGMVMAEIALENGEYKIYRSGKDVTDEIFLAVSREELDIISNYLTLPPVILDNSYNLLSAEQSGYVLEKKGAYVYVNTDFYIVGVSDYEHNISYAWNEGTLEDIVAYFKYSEVAVELIEPWKIK